MSNPTTPLEQAQQLAQLRARELNLSYAGALTPAETYTWLQNQADTYLVDVRTSAEWQWVGQPQLAAEQYRKIEWNQASTGSRNPNFLAELQAQVPAGATVFFLCRSGVRSHAAAEVAQAQGYQAFNILHGFEGDKNAEGHRSTVNGWCFSQLPWHQG